MLLSTALVAAMTGCVGRTSAGIAASDATPIGDGNGSQPATDSDLESQALALLPVDAWSESRILRQRVEIAWASGREGFDAVLQHRPGELALLGLGPMNLVGFRLALVSREGEETVEFENRTGRSLPFSARHILADVQRVYYPWHSARADCGACAGHGRVEAIAVVERIEGGRLAERRFRLVGAPERGEVVVRYSDWRGDPAHPARVELDNGWFGYRLALDTLEALPVSNGPSR